MRVLSLGGFRPSAGFAPWRVSPLGGLGPSAGFATVRVSPLCGLRPSAGFAPLRVSPLCGFGPLAGFALLRVSPLCWFRSSAGFALVRFSPLCGLNNAKSPDAGYRRRQICPEVFCCWRRSRSLKRCNLHITLKHPMPAKYLWVDYFWDGADISNTRESAGCYAPWGFLHSYKTTTESRQSRRISRLYAIGQILLRPMDCYRPEAAQYLAAGLPDWMEAALKAFKAW